MYIYIQYCSLMKNCHLRVVVLYLQKLTVLLYERVRLCFQICIAWREIASPMFYRQLCEKSGMSLLFLHHLSLRYKLRRPYSIPRPSSHCWITDYESRSISTMKVTFVTVLLSLFTQTQGNIAALKSSPKTLAEQNDALALYLDKVQELQDDSRGRELIFDAFCSQIISGFIGGIFSFVGANITCGCGLELIPPGVAIACGTSAPVCFIPPDIVCGEPSLSFSLDVLSVFTGGFPFGAQICYDNLKIGGVLDLSAIPFCLSLSPTLLGFLGIPAADAGGNYTIDSLDEACTAKIGEQICTSCDVCSNTTISFNCTNIQEGFEAQCVDIGIIPTSFTDVVRVDEVKLSLDSLS